MLILLPPSESKTAPRRGKPLDLAALRVPELTDARREVLDALASVSGRPDAAEVLGVPTGLQHAIDANTELETAPTARAGTVYTGVLYDALGLDTLDGAARRRAGSRLLIFSALFGVLSPNDRIPAYRLSGGVDLPGVGKLGTFWNSRLTAALPMPPGLVVDCRSATYAAMWRPDPERTLAVRAFREDGGKRTVITHMAKHTRGLIARALCESPQRPSNPAALLELLEDYFARTPVHTAAGDPVSVRVELNKRNLDVITG